MNLLSNSTLRINVQMSISLFAAVKESLPGERHCG